MTSLIEASCRYPRTILGTCCIPWSDAGQLEDGIFRDQIRLLVGQGLRDLYIFGTAGEGYAVSERQFDEIVSIFCAEMNALGAAPMVGLISLSLSTVIERIERAAEQGVRAFQCSLPSWGALSDREVRIFFQEVCGRFPNLNFLHYNLMRAGRVLTPREYAVLAQEHPNLVATKHGGASIEVIGALLREVPQVRHFLTEPGFAAGCTLDAHGKPGLLIS